MPLLGILGGFESHQKQFFEIFEAKYNKRKKLWKISEKIGEISGKIGKSLEKSDKRNFCAFFFSRLTEKRYFGEISIEKTEIFVHGYRQTISFIMFSYKSLYLIYMNNYKYHVYL